MKKFYLLLGLLSMSMFMLLLMGCTKEEPSPVEGEVDNAITLTPIKLFEGKEAKYKPFLGAMSGSFLLKYEGSSEVTLDLEIWENGRKTSSAGALVNIFGRGSELEKEEKELIISIETMPAQDENAEQLMSSVKIAEINPQGTNSYGFTVSRRKDLLAQGLITQGPISFQSDDAAYVFGFDTTSTGMISTKDFSPESLAEIEWGLLFKLRFES